MLIETVQRKVIEAGVFQDADPVFAACPAAVPQFQIRPPSLLAGERGQPQPVTVGEAQLCTGVVESARSAVPVSPPARFCEPLAEPGVRVSTHRALHGLCQQAWLATAQGFGILLPRYRYRAVGTRPRLNSSTPSADGILHVQ